MQCPIHLGHGYVQMVCEDLRDLWSLKFVEQLSAREYFEVFLSPCHSLINCLLLIICVFLRFLILCIEWNPHSS